MFRIDNVKIYKDLSKEELKKYVVNKYNIDDLIDFKIFRKSIDARDKNNIFYNYAFNIYVKNEDKYNFKKLKDIEDIVINKRRNSTYSPIIIGSGPAGLFCALTLVDNGYKPIIIEQGSSVEDRKRLIDEINKTGVINELCNVQFGEGGAGTFSDGKLNTGVNSPYIKKVLDTFYKFGAPEEVTYINKPHIGTDNLMKILVNIRKYIEDKGGKYYFNTKFIDYNVDNDLIEVICNNNKFITDSLVLAIGHSARDTYRLLKSKNVLMKPKNFAVGLRIEHLQSMINDSQYGKKTKLNLPSADYKLVYHGKNRTCYTFCMCPGGVVIASSSENKGITTNGMSEFNRDKDNANSALLVNIMVDDFYKDDVLDGVKFQEELEHKAYILGGNNGYAPVQRVEDFIKDIPSIKIGRVIPSYRPGYKLCNLNEILPKYVSLNIKEAIIDFDKKIKGYNDPDAILTGVETRSSSPLTIIRDEELVSSVKGIYPCGEGAGYAGGITTSAIDGIKVAIKIIEKE